MTDAQKASDTGLTEKAYDMTDENTQRNTRKECYNCWRLIPDDARFCPFCGFNQVEKHGFQLISDQKESPQPPQNVQAPGQSSVSFQTTHTGAPFGSYPYARYRTQRPQQSAGAVRTVSRITWVDIAKTLGVIGAVIYFIAIIMELGAAYLYTEYTPSMVSSPYSFPFYFVIPPFPPLYINGIYSTGYLIAYPAVVLIATASFVIMARKSYSFRKEMMPGYRKKTTSDLMLMAGLFMAYLFVSIASVLFVADVLGQPVPTPNFNAVPTNMLIFDLTFAPIWEETVYRFMLIGIPLTIFYMLTGKGDGRKKWKYLPGGNMKITPPVLILIALSSLIFGFAHWSSGAGWGLWKVVPAGAAGIILAYLYVKKGLYASILFHFSVDATGIISSPVTSSMALNDGLGIMLYFWATVGIIFFVYWIMVIYGFFTGKNILPAKVRARYTQSAAVEGTVTAVADGHAGNAGGQDMQQGTQSSPGGQSGHYDAPDSVAGMGGGMHPYRGNMPSVPGDLVFGYSCSNCGGLEAKYQDGKLICVFCGHENMK